ncbi:MAG: hypothetical protein HSCHL_1276 [Hydrogenibacillus schlegelii]|uniref:Uncharacterized protein n=1 Tax=Hydrogenibacillus schlegelii TaxID=1484 RepID=A0A2T5GCJ3_HYDSH|nr:MAG: hypothetical protein HSCHL_1276 [Hydrogenibacillus schlegelii]
MFEICARFATLVAPADLPYNTVGRKRSQPLSHRPPVQTPAGPPKTGCEVTAVLFKSSIVIAILASLIFFILTAGYNEDKTWNL